MPVSTQRQFAAAGHCGKFGPRGAAGSGLGSIRHDRENGYPTKLAGQRSPRLGPQFGADITNVSSKSGKMEPLKNLPQLAAPEKPVVTLRLETALLAQSVQPAPNEPANSQHVAEYVSDIDEKLFREEAAPLPCAEYMDMQSDLTPNMRMILMDWLIEVHMKYRLRSETLHLTTNLIDRYLAKTQIERKRLQLVGVCAMYIAAKFEEISPPELHDWVYITDKAYTKDDVLRMECSMLSRLSFKVAVPTAAHFLCAFQQTNGCDDGHRSLAQYILELSIIEIQTLHFAPSQLVAAALLLSNEILGRCPAWPSEMQTKCRHTEPALRTCVQLLRKLFDSDRMTAGGQLQAVHKKFSLQEHHCVATVVF